MCVGLMKVLLWLLHPDPTSRATLKELNKDKWTHQSVDIDQYSFDVVVRLQGACVHTNKLYFFPNFTTSTLRTVDNQFTWFIFSMLRVLYA